MLIDKLAYSSKFCGIDVRVKTAFSMLMLAACILSGSAAVNLAALLLMTALAVSGGTPIKSYMHLMSIPFVFMVISTLTIAFTAGGSADMYYLHAKIGGTLFGIGRESLRTGIHSMVKAASAVSCMYFLALTTPMIQLFAFIYSTVIPDFIVELCQLIYRYVFVLMDAAASIRTAQKSRLGYETLKGKYRSTAALGAMMFIRAYRQAERTYTALESRGYDGSLKMPCERGKTGIAYAVCAVGIPMLFIAADIVLRCAR